MKKKYIIVLTIVLLGWVSSFSYSSMPSKINRTRIEKDLDSLFASIPEFSGVILVAEKGRAVYHKAFGFKNFSTKEPLTTASIFELASVSKQFTAMTIMMMQEEGRLSFDDDIGKYIPGLPYPGITIRHLLNHTSGLPDYQEVMDRHWDKGKVAGNADNIAYLIAHHPPGRFEPGEKYEYSNTGYMLLASIAEKVSGQDFIDLCKQRIFLPSAMVNTGIRTSQEKKALKDMASGHIFVKETQRYVLADSFPQFNYAIWLGNRKGPGRVSSTTNDLLKWDRMLYTNKMVKPATLAQAFSPARLNDGAVSNYGFGWEIQQNKKLGKVVRHTGDNPGYSTQFIRFVDADKTIILLCNNAHEKVPLILQKVEEFLERQ